MKVTVPGKYSQDESGQWWCDLGEGRRIRAYPRACQHCGQEYVSRKRTQKFCSHRCNALAMERPAPVLTPDAEAGPDLLNSQGDARYTRDSDGQWWFEKNPSGMRARCIARTCPHCQRRFLTSHLKQKFCGHACTAAATAAARPRTTQKRSVPSEGLRHSDNTHYSRDSSGQWWYAPSETAKRRYRTRAYILTCEQCGGQFLANIYHRKKADFCSRSCALRSTSAQNKAEGKFRGPRGGNWRGGKRISAKGYVETWCPTHPTCMGKAKPYVWEHRLVMEKTLGRVMRPEENVHHINGVRSDNRPENLELWSRSQPSGQRVEDKVKWARELLALYGDLYPA